ncbi:MAG: hypothetical protein Q7U74_14510, partial [Saprospiraceae bacterium]|nr:hypothetical protein [Saprospiraceae bacterium]
GCSLVCCDISPLGIAAAQAAGLPSVLIENFTWDWIYSGFLASEPEFNPYISAFATLFQQATQHIQTEPVCSLSPNASLLTLPVSRKPRLTRNEVRSKLGVPENSRLVLVTMGGFELEYTFLDRLFAQNGACFVIPGGSDRFETRQNLFLLPHRSNYYHPDLLHASDAVISKAGYSTIAEAYHAGIPFGYVSRSHFRESPVLSNFIQTRMAGFEIDGLSFQTGHWIDQIPDLLDLPRIIRHEPDGADQIAQFLKKEFFTRQV